MREAPCWGLTATGHGSGRPRSRPYCLLSAGLSICLPSVSVLETRRGTGQSGSLSGLVWYGNGTQSHRPHHRRELRGRRLAPITWQIFCTTRSWLIWALLGPRGDFNCIPMAMVSCKHCHLPFVSVRAPLRLFKLQTCTLGLFSERALNLSGSLCDPRLSSCSLLPVGLFKDLTHFGLSTSETEPSLLELHFL